MGEAHKAYESGAPWAPPIDYDYVLRRITIFLRDFLAKTGAGGYVVGLSGGVDSSVTVTLLARSVGPGRVHALILPDKASTPRRDVEDAVGLAEELGVGYTLLYINDVLDSFASSLPFYDPGSLIANGNLKARVRMAMLYYYANLKGFLVAGTGDKSEILLGYYTKYGDGGVDLLPIGDLYKTQVRRLALRLGLPERIALKPSSPRLWPGHLAEEELGCSYETIDKVLYHYVDLGMDAAGVSEATGVPLETVRRIIARVHANEHKRLPPVILRLTPQAVGHDWRMPWYSRPEL